jgi:ABC-type branched-subunit amino acid transport system ATPase component
MLTVRGLTKAFGGLVAVDDLSFEITAGRTTALVGPNGAGKTTVFNLVTGFLTPTAGTVVLRGQDITGWRPHRVAHAGVARTFQNLRLFARLSVLDNVLGSIPGQPGENPLYSMALPWAVRRRHRSDVEAARQWLGYVGLADKARLRAGELSYGQQKRLSIARVLATGAEVLLLDEPSSGLDPAALEDLLKLIEGLPEAGKTLVLVEHNLDVVSRLCDRLLFLDRGRLIAEGRPDEIFARSELADLYFGKVSKGDTPESIETR